MNVSLAGKVAFVTGSGRGMGNAIARKLLALGADVAIHDLREDSPAQYGEFATVHEAAAALASDGRRVIAVTGNLADAQTVAAMAAGINAQLGQIDILVNCAGGDIGAAGGKPNPNNALQTSAADMMAVFQNNFFSLVNVCQAVVPGMVSRQKGVVVNIASGLAHFAIDSQVAYCSAKAAVAHYTRCLAAETRPHGVRVNAISPGQVMTARFLNTRAVDESMAAESVSLDRYGKPEEIADVVAFLASDAASFIHGQAIRVDGGLTLFH